MIELYKTTKTLNIEGKRAIYIDEYVPEEIVLNKPQFVNLRPVTVWRTSKWLHENKIIDYEFFKTINEFKGTSQYNEILLIETWIDYGDDGHTNYYLLGWTYITEKDLQQIQQKMDDKPYGYSTFFQELQDLIESKQKHE